MNVIEAVTVQCPYCWEMIEMTIDCSVPSQEYVEDCEVCCQPIVLQVDTSGDESPKVEVKREN